ncbi:MAG: hypothetical protein NC217_06530 [Muribaculaceae bacterium]|nr:hypothetical protein [Muribaculaceae bacterium]
MKAGAVAIICACFATITGGFDSCARSGSTSDSDQAAKAAILSPYDRTEAANAWADSVISTMTHAELVGQVLMPASYANTDAATIEQLLRYCNELKVGSIAFHKGSMTSMRQIADTLNATATLPLFLGIDAENGLGMRLEGATIYPLNYQLTDSTQTQLYDYGHNVGLECGETGINMVFGPVLDVVPGPGWYMYKRSLGSDPQRVADLGAAYARGLHDTGVIPVAKHFPGHGYTHTDPHVWIPIIGRSKQEFTDIDLLPFQKYIDQGFPAIMAAHVAVPALSGDTLPADFSTKIINQLLRKNMGYNGLVISDAINMGAVKTIRDNSMAPPVRALLAGVDMILAPADTHEAQRQILAALNSGQLPLDILKAHVHRILFHKYLFLR